MPIKTNTAQFDGHPVYLFSLITLIYFDENLSALSAFLELDSGKALVTL